MAGASICDCGAMAVRAYRVYFPGSNPGMPPISPWFTVRLGAISLVGRRHAHGFAGQTRQVHHAFENSRLGRRSTRRF